MPLTSTDKDKFYSWKFKVPINRVDYGQDIMVQAKKDSKLRKLLDLETWRAEKSKYKNCFFRYIVLCYDLKSPIARDYFNDVQLRKEQAYYYAGFDEHKNTKLNKEEKDALFTREWPNINDMILEYFVKILRDAEWRLIMGGMERFADNERAMMSVSMDSSDARDSKIISDTVKNKNIIFWENRDILKTVNELAESFFGDVNDELANDLPVLSPETLDQYEHILKPVWKQ